MNNRLVRLVLLAFLIVATVLIGIAALTVHHAGRLAVSAEQSRNTRASTLEVEAAYHALLTSEGTLRSHALTGDVRDQAACEEALNQIGLHLTSALALAGNGSDGPRQLGELAHLVSRRAEHIRDMLAARTNGAKAGVRSHPESDAGVDSAVEIGRRVALLRQATALLLDGHAAESRRLVKQTMVSVWLGVALNFLLIGATAWLLRDDLSVRQLATTLQASNARLGTQARDRASEHAAAIQAIEQQMRHSQAIIDSIGDLVLVMARTLIITRVNPAVLRHTGLNQSELLYQPLARFVRLIAPPDNDIAAIDLIAQALKDGRELRDQPAVIEDHSGHLTPMRFTLFPLREGDHVVGGIVTLQPIPPALRSAR